MSYVDLFAETLCGLYLSNGKRGLMPHCSHVRMGNSLLNVYLIRKWKVLLKDGNNTSHWTLIVHFKPLLHIAVLLNAYMSNFKCHVECLNDHRDVFDTINTTMMITEILIVMMHNFGWIRYDNKTNLEL